MSAEAADGVAPRSKMKRRGAAVSRPRAGHHMWMARFSTAIAASFTASERVG